MSQHANTDHQHPPHQPTSASCVRRVLRGAIMAALLACAQGAQGQGSTSPMIFTGMCDASGAIPLPNNRFAVADDEDNVLRIYDAERGGAPLHMTDISTQLGLPVQLNKKGQPKAAPETDIEAATVLGEQAYWITSYGRNSQGKLKPERMRFFTTSIPDAGGALRVTAVASENFFSTLVDAPQLRQFALRQAATLAPKQRNGLNIEGLAAMPDGRLLLGFRNPVPQGRALLVPLENPREVMAGKAARFGKPIQLELAGLGIRALLWQQDHYLIVAGHYDSGAASALYNWDGKGKPVRIDITFGDINPEALLAGGAPQRVMLISDDGARPIDGRECKHLKEQAHKQFRGLWVQWPR